MKAKLSWAIFWALAGVFVTVASLIAIPAAREFLNGCLFITAGVLFLLLGAALIVFTVREKVKGMLKKFLILTGASSAGVVISVLLHNAIYGLFIYFFGADFWNGGDEPVFFVMAVFICPIGFLAGSVGSIVLALKRLRAEEKSSSNP